MFFKFDCVCLSAQERKFCGVFVIDHIFSI